MKHLLFVLLVSLVSFVSFSAPVKSMLGADGNEVTAEDILPYDAELEYIELTGTQWLDTRIGLLGAVSFGYDIAFSPTAAALEQRILSAEGSTPTYDIYCEWDDSTLRCRPMGGRMSFSNGDFIRCSYLDGILQIEKNGAVYNSWTYAFRPVANNYSVTIGTRSNNRKLETWHFVGKVFYVSLYIDNALVLDLVPVRIGEVGFFYDRVTGNFFRNMGTGAFVLGPDKEVE